MEVTDAEFLAGDALLDAVSAETPHLSPRVVHIVLRSVVPLTTNADLLLALLIPHRVVNFDVLKYLGGRRWVVASHSSCPAPAPSLPPAAPAPCEASEGEHRSSPINTRYRSRDKDTVSRSTWGAPAVEAMAKRAAQSTSPSIDVSRWINAFDERVFAMHSRLSIDTQGALPVVAALLHRLPFVTTVTFASGAWPVSTIGTLADALHLSADGNSRVDEGSAMLETLRMCDCVFACPALGRLPDLKTITALDMSGQRQEWHSEDLAAIAKMPALRRLAVAQVSNFEPLCVDSFVHLEHLVVTDTRGSALGLPRVLAAQANLSVLALHRMTLREVDGVSKSASLLAAIPQSLERLSLMGSTCTNADMLRPLTLLPKLAVLSLQHLHFHNWRRDALDIFAAAPALQRLQPFKDHRGCPVPILKTMISICGDIDPKEFLF